MSRAKPPPVYADDRSRVVAAGPAELWRVIEGVGGEHGWYGMRLAWSVRGLLDRLVGGVGLRRGRRHPARLRVGDPVDFWRVVQVVPGRLLQLRAEMRLPGVAELVLSVGEQDGRTLLRQRTTFRPSGAAGRAYWWSVWPVHGLVFAAMARNLGRQAERVGAARRHTGEGGGP